MKENNKKAIIIILIAVLIIAIGIVITYKLIEKSITNREDFKYTVDDITSSPVDTINNEQKKSAENFEIILKNRQLIERYNKVYVILDKSETTKYDYTIYAYDGSVNIKVDGKEYHLKEALLENKITMEENIAKNYN